MDSYRTILLALLSIATALSTTACNSLTGIGGISVGAEDGDDGNDDDGDGDDDDAEDDDDDQPAHGSGGDGSGNGTGSGSPFGAGGASSAAGPSTSSAASGPTGTSVSSSSSGSGTPSACEYPAGNYGNTQGATLDPSFSWRVFLEGASQTTTMTPADLLDCDGTHGTNAILLIGGITSCGVCQQEASELPGNMASWGAMGIRVVYLMFDESAAAWRDYFGLEDIVVGDDSAYSLIVGQGAGTPINVVVDPRTMQVVLRQEGYGGPVESTLTSLAQSNAP